MLQAKEATDHARPAQKNLCNMGATFDKVMLWAACCMGFFGFMRAGEFTSPSSQTQSGAVLSVSDVTVDIDRAT